MPSNAARITALLRGMGFSQTAGRVYSRLLVGGPAPASRIRFADVTDEQLRTALRQLQSGGLIGRDRDRQVEIVYATEPSLSVVALVTGLVWQIIDEVADVDELPRTEHPAVEQLRSAAAELLE